MLCRTDPSLDENETIRDVMHQESVAVDVKKVRIYAQQINHLIEKSQTKIDRKMNPGFLSKK